MTTDVFLRTGELTATDVRLYPAAVTATGHVYSSSPNDAAPAADSAARSGVHTRLLSDATPAVETPVRSSATARSLAAELAPVLDAVTRLVSRTRAVADSSPATAMAARTVVLTRWVPDAASADATVVAGQWRVIGLTDTASAQDILQRRLLTARLLADVAGAVDAPGIVLPRRSLFLFDSARASDSLVRFVRGDRYIAVGALGEELGAAMGAYAGIFETSGVEMPSTARAF